MKKIYLDNAATTKVYPKVMSEMNKIMQIVYGNPSSLHALGEEALSRVNQARAIIAKEINAKPWEIIFTSCATESNNIALRSIERKGRDRILISSIEHPSVRESAKKLNELGYKIVEIPVDSSGLIDFDFLQKELDKNRSKIKMVSIMHVNNILGTIQDIKKIGKVCKKAGILFHTDAVQSFGKIKIDVKNYDIDMLSASAHKIGGPKGVGFLYVKEGIKVDPWLVGGGQEREIRSGTENVAGIVGFAKALEIIKKVDQEKIKKLKQKLSELLEDIGGKINSGKGIYNILNVSFPRTNGENLVYRLSKSGIYVSAGSACDSKKGREDHVLRAIGMKNNEIEGSIRISLNEDIKEEDIYYFIKNLRKLAN